MTGFICRPERQEGPGFDCHSERSEESGLAFERPSPQILHAFGIQNDTTRFFGHETGLRMTFLLSS